MPARVDEVAIYGLPLNYQLSYFAGPGGSLTGSSSQTVQLGSNGTPVTAVPDTNYRFVQWSDSSVTNPRTDLAVTSDIAVTALFEQNFPPNFTGYEIWVDQEEPATVSFFKLLFGVPQLLYKFLIVLAQKGWFPFDFHRCPFK